MIASPTGLWRCEAPKGCERAQLRTPFSGPSQQEAQRLSDPIRCPDCAGTLVMYAGDHITAEEDHDAA